MKKRRFREMKLEKKKCKRKRNNFVFVPTMLYFWNFQRKKKFLFAGRLHVVSSR